MRQILRIIGIFTFSILFLSLFSFIVYVILATGIFKILYLLITVFLASLIVVTIMILLLTFIVTCIDWAKYDKDVTFFKLFKKELGKTLLIITD